MVPDVIAYPEDSVTLKFNMFDRTATKISSQILSLKGGEVTFLEEAYSYTIELISMGVEVLCFKSIALCWEGGEP